MNFDLKGSLSLLIAGGRKTAMRTGYRGHANIKGQIRQDSFYIFFINKEMMKPGETCLAKYGFLFREDEQFKISVKVGDVFELNEGRRKIGEFIVEELLSSFVG